MWSFIGQDPDADQWTSPHGDVLDGFFNIMAIPVDILKDFQTTAKHAERPAGLQFVRELLPLATKQCREAHRKLMSDLNIKDTTLRSPKLVVAPETELRGEHRHTCGIIHRDVDTTSPGYLSVLLFIDDVTQHNGCVRFWPDTQLTKLDKRNRTRSVKTKSWRDVYGPAGTVVVFDSRLLHR